jgi:hypothetical protein
VPLLVGKASMPPFSQYNKKLVRVNHKKRPRFAARPCCLIGEPYLKNDLPSGSAQNV